MMGDKQPESIGMVCTAETFRPCYTVDVRWLDCDEDFHLAQEAWANVSRYDLSKDEWLSFRDDGFTYCGVIEDGMLVSSAAVFTRTKTEWEAAAVWTLEGYQRRGYAKSVVSFVTQKILGSGHLATCHTRRDNAAMIATALSVGFVPRGEPAEPG
jgi:hypothetical protein